jgi:hypothetical protein
MANASEIHLVRVMTDNREHKLWAVAAPRDEAVNAVLDVVPEGWSAALLDNELSDQESQALNLRPGDVREITSRAT